MDPRIDVHRIFQFQPGDVFILRNAGNIYTDDVLRSILIAIHEYNIQYIIVLGHIDCAMKKIKARKLRDNLTLGALKYICGKSHNVLIDLIKFFRPFADELKNINNQVEKIHSSRGLLGNVEVIGMLYDVDTGWVFEYDKIKDFAFVEDFTEKYYGLLDEKRKEFLDFLEIMQTQVEASIERELELKTIVLDELDDDQEFEDDNKNDYKKLFNIIDKEIFLNVRKNKDILSKNQVANISLSIEVPKIHIPKINFPKINVSVPHIYRKKKQNSNDILGGF